MNLDPNELSKWNCVIEPQIKGSLSYGGLYLADIDCAKDQYLLSKLQINAVLSVIDFPEVNLPDTFIHSKICIPDSEDESLLDHFPLCFNFIDENRKLTNVMVHCYAGISRSATVILGYMMKHFDWNLDRAYEILWCLRKQIQPNEGFIKQLKIYEENLQKQKFSYQNKAKSSNQILEKVEQDIETRQKNLENLRRKYKQIQNYKLVPQCSQTIL